MTTRRAVPLVLLLWLLPGAQAQAVELVQVEIAPFPGLVTPLQGPATTYATVEVTCPGQAVQDAQVDMLVTHSPAWAAVVLSPSRLQFPASSCQTGPAAQRVSLVVTADDQAPAFRPHPIRIEARLTSAPTPQNASAQVELTAGYFAVLDVQLTEAIRSAPPGTVVPFVLHVENHGNARSRLTTTVTRVDAPLTVDPVAPVELGSRQAGDAQTRADVVVVVRTPAREGLVNEVGTVDLRLALTSVDHPELPGDEASASLLLTTRTAEGTPLSALVALLALGAAAGARRR